METKSSSAKHSKHVVVGSTSIIKLEAVKEALSQGFSFVGLEGPFDVGGVAAKSGVSEQPVGREETLIGAKNRALGAKALQPDSDLWIGIENGLFWEEDEKGHTQWYDAAKIFVMLRWGSSWCFTSDKLYIPTWVLENVYGKDRLQELKKGGKTSVNWAGAEKDPHSIYSVWKENGSKLRSRKDFLKDAIPVNK